MCCVVISSGKYRVVEWVVYFISIFVHFIEYYIIRVKSTNEKIKNIKFFLTFSSFRFNVARLWNCIAVTFQNILFIISIKRNFVILSSFNNCIDLIFFLVFFSNRDFRWLNAFIDRFEKMSNLITIQIDFVIEPFLLSIVWFIYAVL